MQDTEELRLICILKQRAQLQKWSTDLCFPSSKSKCLLWKTIKSHKNDQTSFYFHAFSQNQKTIKSQKLKMYLMELDLYLKWLSKLPRGLLNHFESVRFIVVYFNWFIFPPAAEGCLLVPFCRRSVADIVLVFCVNGWSSVYIQGRALCGCYIKKTVLKKRITLIQIQIWADVPPNFIFLSVVHSLTLL